LGFGGSDIPRDATTRATLGTSPWDVSRGGFSGAQMGLSRQAGSNFSTRGLSTLLNTPSTQWTDRAGRSLGAQYTSASLGAATAGPISMDKTFYSIGYQFDRRMSDLPTLADAVARAPRSPTLRRRRSTSPLSPLTPSRDFAASLVESSRRSRWAAFPRRSCP